MGQIGIVDKVNYHASKITNMQQMVCTGLFQPNCGASSASRKLMLASNLPQVLSLVKPEVAYYSTGYENRFGEYSSSFIEADQDYIVIDKISKYPENPDHYYFLILKSRTTEQYTVVERVIYNHNTESFGYLFNNNNLDKIQPGQLVPKGTTLKKSTGFDDVDNRQDGLNFDTVYMNLLKTLEDGIVMSETAGKALAAPTIHPITIDLNDNDIPLNLYGNFNMYKFLPDINENIKNNILAGVRREKKEECLFSQNLNRLTKLLMSDDKYTTTGQIVDIEVYCNNPEKLENNFYYSQVKYYHDLGVNFARKMVEAMQPIYENKENNCSYQFKDVYFKYKNMVDGKKWMKNTIDKKVFSFCVIDVKVLEIKHMEIGDKVTNRYGGKGVVSAILPDHLMPRKQNGDIIHIVYNSQTVCNRLNPGQLFEQEVNAIGCKLLESLRMGILPPGTEVDYYLEFIRVVSPKQYYYIKTLFEQYSEQQIAEFLNSICESNAIYIAAEPFETMTLDKMAELYNIFDWIKQEYLLIPQEGSDGSIRYINTRRPLTVGSLYLLRLKQYAEDKFSATSLSATNLRNENTKSKANKMFKQPFSRNPINWGGMEISQMQAHLGAETVVKVIMGYSTSVHARMMAEQMLENDPYDINIELDDTCKNSAVEIMNAYMKTLGLRINIKRVMKKFKQAVNFSTVHFVNENGEKIQQAVSFDRPKAVSFNIPKSKK